VSLCIRARAHTPEGRSNPARTLTNSLSRDLRPYVCAAGLCVLKRPEGGGKR